MKSFFSTRKKSFAYAFSGIRYVLKTQKNAWIHLFISVSVILVGFLVKLDAVEWALIAVCIALVWVAECINTSIEAFVDLTSPNEHPLAKISKDVGAAGVLIAALISVIVGLLVLGPPLFRLIF
jgi:diacylglycerol kinase (ATP)